MKTRMTSAERRTAIVAASIRLFAERGFRGTTTKELAAAVGVSEPVLYQHFHAKSDLYSAIIEAKAEEGKEMADRRLGPYLQGADDRAFFTALAELVLDRYERDPTFIRLLMFSALEGHELAALFFERQLLDFYRIVSGYIERRMKQDALRCMNPKIAARAFLGMVNHHGLVRVLFQDSIVRAGRKKFIDEIVRTFLHGIASKETEVK